MGSSRLKYKIDAEGECLLKFEENTYDYHQCLCQFDFPVPTLKKFTQLKIQHCLIARDTLKRTNFENYLYIALAAGVVFIAIVVIICTYKWYSKINNNPFQNCGPCLCCCKKNKRQKNDSSHPSDSHWTTVNGDAKSDDEPRSTSLCMKFCMSDPVQDCCEFFDCDILWRRKNIYMIPIFGRRKVPGPLQRRPTRPAPPPPKAIVLPVMKYPEPIMCDEYGDCDPVPEAPPSPEPVRATQPKPQSKGMYVDPIAFLQRPFMKSREKSEDEPDPLYSRVKDYVLGKVRKSASMASLNKLGVSANPDGSLPQNGTKKSGKYSKTASLASLHDLSDNELDKNYSTKRSQSLASLHMHEDDAHLNNLHPNGLGAPGCRMSMDMDDVPPSARKDEYIDLEEMSKRIAAKTAQNNAPVHDQHRQQATTAAASTSYTPNYIPASAFPNNTPNRNPSFSTFQQVPNTSIIMDSVLIGHAMQHCPPVPASGGKPPVPARTAIGSPLPSQMGTLGRPKPVIPPRPPPNNFGHHSPKARAPPNHRASPSPVPRGSIVKPSGPPPPPPDVPIESSI